MAGAADTTRNRRYRLQPTTLKSAPFTDALRRLQVVAVFVGPGPGATWNNRILKGTSRNTRGDLHHVDAGNSGADQESHDESALPPAFRFETAHKARCMCPAGLECCTHCFKLPPCKMSQKSAAAVQGVAGLRLFFEDFN